MCIRDRPRLTTDRLRSHARRFQFVEVNVTFYRYVKPETARKWRIRVASDFDFSVKCSKELTHVQELAPIEESYIVFDRMKEICRELSAKILILQTPSSMRIDKRKIESLRDFFTSLDRDGLDIGWEVRSRIDNRYRSALSELILENDITHVTVLSTSLPIARTPIVYTRLFGRGGAGAPAYRFTREQLEEIRERALSLEPSKVNYAFHSLRMYEDAEIFLRGMPMGTTNFGEPAPAEYVP